MIADRPEIRAFHGRRGCYSETELNVTESFLDFSNDREGFAPPDAHRPRGFLQSETHD